MYEHLIPILKVTITISGDTDATDRVFATSRYGNQLPGTICKIRLSPNCKMHCRGGINFEGFISPLYQRLIVNRPQLPAPPARLLVGGLSICYLVVSHRSHPTVYRQQVKAASPFLHLAVTMAMSVSYAQKLGQVPGEQCQREMARSAFLTPAVT